MKNQRSPKSLENLRPFKPGQSGNPGGRRPGLSLTRFVRDELEQPSRSDPSKTKGQQLATVIVDHAIEAHTTFAPLVWRYVDGDPKQAAELTLQELAEQLAERMGLDVNALLSAFKRDMGAA